MLEESSDPDDPDANASPGPSVASHAATPTKIKPIASPSGKSASSHEGGTVKVLLTALTWNAWVLDLHVYSPNKGKEVSAYTSTHNEPDTIAHALSNNTKVAWHKDQQKTEDLWHFVRLTPDIPSSEDGYNMIKASIEKMFSDKVIEWNARPDASLTTNTQRWSKRTWNNSLAFTLNNTIRADGSLLTKPWDSHLLPRTILRLVRDCFPGVSLEDMDKEGGFYSSTAADVDGNPMSLVKAAENAQFKYQNPNSNPNRVYD